MSTKNAISLPPCDIDQLLQNTWLQVVSLRHGASFQEGEGRKYWQRCVADIEAVQRALKEADYSEQSCQHILYTQCAVLDETVKGRDQEDDAYVQWCNSPLQAYFFGTLEAGNQLYERMRQVLREPVPDLTVLTCFHRSLMLGFLGGYASSSVPEREQLVAQLSERVPTFDFSQTRPILVLAPGRQVVRRWLSHWPVRLGLSAAIVALLWWGLDLWLDGLLPVLLPGVIR